MIKLSENAKRDLHEKTPIESVWEGGQILLDTAGELWLVANDNSITNLVDGRVEQVDDLDRDQYVKVVLEISGVKIVT